MLAEEAEGAQPSNEWEVRVKAHFLKDLFQFMDSRDLPIERIPQLGFKELDLFLLYKTVQKLGGFDQVTAQQKWKQVYSMLGADPRSTSAATSTRRHYEKLLLPYDRHLMQKTPPPSLKRPRHHSPSLQDEESLRGSKRSAACTLPNPTLTQRSPDISTDCTVRITPKTTDYQLNGDPPSYHTLYPNIPPPQTNNQPHVHPRLHPYLHSHSHQELRSLAERAVIDSLRQIGSSSGYEQPLNLSCWGRGRDPVGQRLPSFTPPTDKKVPKFLNRVSSLYQAWCFQEGNVYRLPSNLPTREAEQTQLEFESISVQEKIIDLTTSSDISLSSPPPTNTYLYPPPPLRSTCGPPDITVNKTQERKYPLQTGEVEGPFKLNHSFSNPSAGSLGKMQTEFASLLLKARFRGAEGVVTSSGKQWCQQGVTEPRPTKHDDASELGFSFRDPDRRSSFGESVHWNGIVKGEESLRPTHRGSLCDRWQDREPVSDRHGNAHWPHPWCRDPKALGPFHQGWLEAQELLAGRLCPSAWPTPSTRYPPGSAGSTQEPSQSTLGPGVALEPLKGIPATTMGPSEVLKGDTSPSLLMRLTPAEYWSLRQLLSGSY
ncbi:AT-rich interactive domain-containing protein 1B-like [Anguilla rostrata]|uniref:AT-rich interactive domain-containing protein 1B-like n=1 Tax=Anguilla rostrata TaxID=7938 RepID=UPI0030D36CA9